ncbi:MAG: DUF2147 domain-containing protein [Bacteroidales bacterium]|nr:DUF2147 domain-containing protein [Bacteroidales bacterium]
MKKISLLLTLILMAKFAAFGQSDDIVGIWLTDEDKSQVRIFKATNGKYYGKIEWLKEDKDKKDVENPDPKLKDKPVMGLTILKGFTYDEAKKQWSGGTIYDPKEGKTYDCYMWFEGDKKVLQIKGYVLGMKFVGRKTIWKKEDKLRE